MNVDAWAPFCNSINKIDEFDVVGRNRERWRLIEKRLYTKVRFQLNAFHERIRMNKIAKKENRSPISVTTKKKQILDDVRARYSCEILKRLADEDAKISKRIDDLALEYLVEVNPDHIAESVFSDLDRLAVEDVWDNSGGTRDGYVDPNELASEMFEEALEPYIDELRKCQELSLAEEAKLRCMGI